MVAKSFGLEVMFAVSAGAFLACGCSKDPAPKDVAKALIAVDRNIRQSDYITVPVTIDGQKCDFILDTGCEIVVVDSRLRYLFANTARTDVPTVTIENIGLQIEVAGPAKSFRIGSHISYTGDVGVCDLSRFGLVGYDGIIGMSFLRHFALLLDFENDRIELAADSNMLSHKEGICSLDLLGKDDDLPFVTMCFDNVRENFLVDTGMPGTSFLRKEVFESVIKESDQQKVVLDSIDGKKEGTAGYVEGLVVGHLKYGQMTFICERSSIMGLQFFKQHKKVICDFKNRRMHLVP